MSDGVKKVDTTNVSANKRAGSFNTELMNLAAGKKVDIKVFKKALENELGINVTQPVIEKQNTVEPLKTMEGGSVFAPFVPDSARQDFGYSTILEKKTEPEKVVDPVKKEEVSKVEAPTKKTVEYKIIKGDTLSEIAHRLRKSEEYKEKTTAQIIDEIAKENKIADIGKIYEGQKLSLKAELAPAVTKEVKNQKTETKKQTSKQTTPIVKTKENHVKTEHKTEQKKAEQKSVIEKQPEIIKTEQKQTFDKNEPVETVIRIKKSEAKEESTSKLNSWENYKKFNEMNLKYAASKLVMPNTSKKQKQAAQTSQSFDSVVRIKKTETNEQTQPQTINSWENYKKFNEMNLKNAASKLVITDKKEKTMADYLPKDVVEYYKAHPLKFAARKDNSIVKAQTTEINSTNKLNKMSDNVNAKLETKKADSITSKAVEFGNDLAGKVEEGDAMHRTITEGHPEHQWCAYTMSYIYQKAGNGKSPFGYKGQVEQVKKWAENKHLYHSLSGTNAADRETKLIEQVKNINKGDLMVWKSDFNYPLVDGGVRKGKSSHIGMFLGYQNGEILIIEGNTNILKKDANGKYYLVKNKEEGANGRQSIGELQELNKEDSLMIKRYKPSELIQAGFSGYINMQNLK